jgi:hypothetical protein
MNTQQHVNNTPWINIAEPLRLIVARSLREHGMADVVQALGGDPSAWLQRPEHERTVILRGFRRLASDYRYRAVLQALQSVGGRTVADESVRLRGAAPVVVDDERERPPTCGFVDARLAIYDAAPITMMDARDLGSSSAPRSALEWGLVVRGDDGRLHPGKLTVDTLLGPVHGGIALQIIALLRRGAVSADGAAGAPMFAEAAGRRGEMSVTLHVLDHLGMVEERDGWWYLVREEVR